MRVSNVKIEDRLLLSKACNEGCRDSLAEIHSKHQASILAYLRKRLSHRNITEDILQEVYRQVLEGKCAYNGSSDPQKYLIGVALTLVKNELSKEKAAPSVNLNANLADLFNDNERHKPIDRLEGVELRQDLQAAISKLPAKSRKAIESVYCDGKTYNEVATELGVNYETLRKRIKYALSTIKKSKIFKSINPFQ